MLRFVASSPPLPLVVLTVLCRALSLGQYVPQVNTTSSRSILLDVGWKCEDNSDCTIDSASCVNKLCQCPVGYLYNANMTSCLKVATKFGDQCVETIQCSRYLLSGATCTDNVCACSRGFYYLHGRCHRMLELSEECRTDDDCHINSEIGSTVCDKGICKCKPGFYQREHRSCRPAAKDIGSDCVIDLDCKSIKNASCDKDFKCATGGNIVNAANSPNSDDKKYANEIAVTSEWRNCIKDSDCTIYKNAICGIAGKCVCKRAHFLSANANDMCVPELGEACNDSDTTVIEYAVCQNGVWTCTSNKVPSADKQYCYKASRSYNYSCLHDEQCYILGPDAICRDRKCICNEKSHYVKKEEFCWKSMEVGEPCKSKEDCYVEELIGILVCDNNTCACSSGTHLNSNRTACISDHAELGAFCEEDNNCATNHSVCVNNTCVCNATEHYYEFDKTCVIGIRGACNESSDCIPANSDCSDGRCACKQGYVSSGTDTCLKVVNYGESCEYDVQCQSATPNALCLKISDTSENKSCTCDADYHLSSSKCYKTKYLGEACTFYDECYLEFEKDRALCINGECMCHWDYVSDGKTRCIARLQARAHPSEFSSGNNITVSRIWLTALSLVWIFSSLF